MATREKYDYVPKGVAAKRIGNVTIFEVPAARVEETFRDLRDNPDLSFKLIEATDERHTEKAFKVWYVFGVRGTDQYVAPFIRVAGNVFPSVAAIFPGAANYERKIQDFFGLEPTNNPDKRRIILHENWPAGVYPLRKDFDHKTRPKTAHEKYAFQRVDGEGIYEIPVGPIHAGIIEPGHFRFSVLGEEIMLLEPRLGFVHKGSEKLFEQLPLADGLRLSEKISGDSSFSHSLGFCQAIEQLADVKVPARARYLRVVYAELERLANHLGDIGAIMLDTGFNFGGAQGPRLREMVMQLNERLSGSRFLRGVNAIGGVTKDISDQDAQMTMKAVKDLAKDFYEVAAIAETNVSLLNRLQGAGVLSPQVAKDYGVMGVAGKAVGVVSDARAHRPYAAYGELGFAEKDIAKETAGDVHARFLVRVKEVRSSVQLIQEALGNLPAGSTLSAPAKIALQKNSLAVGCVEGWRGEILYFVATDSDGNLARVAVRDPSFVNWQAVGPSGAGQMVPDFPLINKSFNMSYSGHDL